MGTESYFERLADAALDGFDFEGWFEADRKELRRSVILALKEVDRDARHRAHEMIETCAHNVFNARPV